MWSELKQSSTVKANGCVEVAVPGLRPGDAVEVSVRFEDATANLAERPLGLLKGKISVAENFDAPLEEFDDNTK